MRQYLNDVTSLPKKCDELDNTIVIASGYDRMKFIEPRRNVAGDLGFDTWIDPSSKPVFNSEGAGALDETKYYSIMVAPVDRTVVTGADFQRGTPTLPSIPQQPSAASKSLVFDIPIHTQVVTSDAGNDTSGVGGTVTDSTKAWTDDEWIGYSAVDIETGESYPISDNTATTLTAAGISLSAGDRYAIQTGKATARDIYALEMSSPDGVSGAYIYQGTVDDNSTATYELSLYVNVGSGPSFSNVPPEPFAYCRSADNRVFAGGGVIEGRGEATVNTTLDTKTASGAANEEITFSVFTEDYAGSATNRVMRAVLGSALSAMSSAMAGSVLNISGTASNDIEDAKVIDVSADGMEVLYYNASGSAETATSGSLEVNPNFIVGNTSGANKTYFSEAFIGGVFSFDGETSYGIEHVDQINQVLTLSDKYGGGVTSSTGYEIQTDYELFWSDFGNPHIWRTENSAEIADRIMSLEVFGGLLLIFCSRSLWKLPLNNLQQNATLVDDGINFVAPHSVVLTPRGVMFHDGTGISFTNGQVVTSVTQYKATDLMRDINPVMSYNIRGEYDSGNRRVEYVFPTGTDITNNAGAYITIDSLNVYPFTRMDCNTIWEDEDESNRPIMMHGTSGRHVASGSGSVYSHPYDQATDGEFGGSATRGSVTAVNSDHMVVDFDAAMTLGEGTYAMFSPDPNVGGVTVQFIVSAVTNSSGNTYEIYFSDDWYSDGFAVGGTVHMTMIPMDYGIKWLDFGSPQHIHKIRQIQMDVTNITGQIVIEHYADLNSTRPIQMDTVNISSSQTKIIVTIRKGSYYTYGFRIRGYSSTKSKIHSYEVLFDTEI